MTLKTNKNGTFFSYVILEHKARFVKIIIYSPKLHVQSLNALSETTYDFIIVGAGSTGAVIATRLSEISKWKVLLLEAGGYPHPMSEIPGLAGLLQFTDNNWNYTYEPQENACLGMVDKRCTCPRGKTLGGTSVINYAVYSRGHPLDYDRWAELGNPGWSYEEVLPYFKKSECTYAEGTLKRIAGGLRYIVEKVVAFFKFNNVSYCSCVLISTKTLYIQSSISTG